MQWTSDAPTEAGVYWVRGAIDRYLVRVYHPYGGGSLCIQYHGATLEDSVDMLGGVQWSPMVAPLNGPP